MKRLVIGILAHVDSGKTTLSEGLLFTAGEIKKLGRVDHKSAFLDTNEIERERGITIFAKQAVIRLPDAEFTLLDTPGHVDFSAEMERTLPVLDYAVLVVNAADGVQGHTETLWRMLAHYQVPVFLFVNKMDLDVRSREEILGELKTRLSEGCLAFPSDDMKEDSITDSFFENVALQGQEMLDEYLETGAVSKKSLRHAIRARQLFPCFFGSALKMEGVSEFLAALDCYTLPLSDSAVFDLALPDGDAFGARVFKISEDEKGQRLTHLKVTRGSLKVKENLMRGAELQKVNELRIYSGAKYRNVPEVFAGSVCAVPGLAGTFPGEGFGSEPDAGNLISEPVFTYTVRLPEGTDMLSALSIFRKLEEEETKMRVLWDERLQTISVQIMGEVQLEVLKRVLEDRFGMTAEFEHGRVLYQETIAGTVYGVGHYEPLRHYAEVHLLITPGERGSGIMLETEVSEDELDRNWQRLILTHLSEKTHIGVLTGSPLTDVKITLAAGRAHQKHTEGGDFRQATYRAVRQGLMQAENILLEPYYAFTLELPTETVGRAMTDLQQMGAVIEPPQMKNENSILSGKAPVAALRDYQKRVLSYTHGRGKLSCVYSGYEPCRNQEQIVREIGYNCEADLDNTADSVFCLHGAGRIIKWNEVFDHMHLPPLDKKTEMKEAEMRRTAEARSSSYRDGKDSADEEELLRIFERTYGKIESVKLHRPSVRREIPEVRYRGKEKPAGNGPSYLLIDGYNIIFAWEELKKAASISLDLARARLIDRISNYQAYKKEKVMIVFDAYRVKGAVRRTERIHGLTVVYTEEAETADQYIEKVTKDFSRNYRVRVATSDYLEQVIILGHGANRVSAPELLKEVEMVEAEMRQYLD